MNKNKIQSYIILFLIVFGNLSFTENRPISEEEDSEEYEEHEGNTCIFYCMLNNQCFEEGSDCNNIWKDYLYIVSENSIQECWDLLLLEQKDEDQVSPEEYTEALQNCFSRIVEVHEDQGIGEKAAFYTCSLECMQENLVYLESKDENSSGSDRESGSDSESYNSDSSDESSSEESEIDEQDICYIECVFANDCVHNNCEHNLDAFHDEYRRPDECHRFWLMNYTDWYTEEELYGKYEECLQAVGSMFDEGSNEREAAFCLSDCAVDQNLPLHKDDDEKDTDELTMCFIGCALNYECYPGQECFEKIDIEYLPHYGGEYNGIQECKDLIQRGNSQEETTEYFISCANQYSELFEYGSKSRDTLQCWNSCVEEQGFIWDIYEHYHYKDGEYQSDSEDYDDYYYDDHHWEWKDEDEWKEECDDKYCYFELFKCWEDCNHIYCPDFMCYEGGYREYDQVKDLNENCQYTHDIMSDIEFTKKPDISVSKKLIDSWAVCSDFLTDHYRRSEDPYILDYFSCQKGCADNFDSEMDILGAYESIQMVYMVYISIAFLAII